MSPAQPKLQDTSALEQTPNVQGFKNMMRAKIEFCMATLGFVSTLSLGTRDEQQDAFAGMIEAETGYLTSWHDFTDRPGTTYDPDLRKEQTSRIKETGAILRKHLDNFIMDDTGATAIEYGLIASLIAVVIITAVTAVGTQLSSGFNNISTHVL
jgi:pilus assembly protein Flp/PilA